MKKLAILFTFLTFFVSISAQDVNKFSFEFGKVNPYELTMTEYEKDKEADAIVIFEQGNYYFAGNDDYERVFSFHLIQNHKIKIKILKKSGIEQANFSIPLYEENYKFEKLIISKATVYNYNKETNQVEKTEFDEKNVFEEKIGTNFIVKKFTMPNVRIGSVIELEYAVETPFIFSFSWQFQKRIPVIYSKLDYKAIPYYSYTYIMKGATKFDEFKTETMSMTRVFHHLQYQEKLFTLAMKNMPAFKDDKFITTPKDYIIAVDFQVSERFYETGGSDRIMTTWQAMNDAFLKDDNFGKYIKKSEKEAKKILPTLNLVGKNQLETLQTIVGYVKSNYNWNGIYGKYIFNQLPEFLKKKSGNDANLNLFLIGLLNASGIEATPVVLSTRENGTISKLHPFDKFFNYVVARVTIENSTYYVDATEPMLYFNQLPERCLNIEGLLVKPKSEEWVRIEEIEPSIVVNEFIIKLLPEQQKYSAEVKFSANAIEAYNLRGMYLGKNESWFTYLKKTYNIDVKLVSVKNELVFDKPFEYSFNITQPIDNQGNKIYIQPFCNLSLLDNPFKQTTRTLPVDMIYRRGYQYRSEIEIPAGYSVFSLPEPVENANAFYSLQYAVKQADNRIEIEAFFEFGKNIYQPGEYNYIKMCVNTAIQKLSEQVVLEKTADKK